VVVMGLTTLIVECWSRLDEVYKLKSEFSLMKRNSSNAPRASLRDGWKVQQCTQKVYNQPKSFGSLF
jgi:hypothetical protein